MILKTLTLNALLYTWLLPWASAQEPPSAAAVPQPKIQVSFLNSCRPAQADLDEMGPALARVKERPMFSTDFEISRGLTTLTEAESRAAGAAVGGTTTTSIWVRIRKEFPEKAILTNAQYSLSANGSFANEVLALHLRDHAPDSVLQILISDSVKGSPAQAVKMDTPPDRLSIERFGKASLVLARCEGVDQSAYEPLFAAAGGILHRYKVSMAVRDVVPAELTRLPGRRESNPAPANH